MKINYTVDLVSFSLVINFSLFSLRLFIDGLRHTHASILLYQGVNILSVSKRLGHSSLETTMSTYTKQTPVPQRIQGLFIRS
ncbi:tyrosine-type recombinase/integrase [Enterococcus faecium]|nr:tyrosine-type recombinase/integrase [Enterococcus faecium]MCZ1368179.1 tyrosine-type recombinase/integrase [Enterococcus faecium]MCZ1387937.1 tyrosine-type recombinase/integrase [Enterococcus faecium]MCZ1405045.1 tyrosine-type recombinase/integrase [Enterococcus faecium]MCZ1410844.1 tyrosine-type recombinase/integrase [Enterococcus faecium]